MVQHDVKTQNFKAHIVGKIVTVRLHVGAGKCGIACDDSLDENLVYLLFYFLHIVALFGDVLINRS